MPSGDKLAEGMSAMRERPSRPQLDASIAEILREEAAREEANRKAEAQAGLERQTDMGLEDLPPAPPPPPAPPVPAARPDATRAAVSEAVASSRRELLPDIEEINSTLRSDRDRAEPEAPEEIEEVERRGFRRGFFGSLAVIAALIALYVYADDIARQVPAVAGPMESYEAAVDSLRLWLDDKARDILVRLEA